MVGLQRAHASMLRFAFWVMPRLAIHRPYIHLLLAAHPQGAGKADKPYGGPARPSEAQRRIGTLSVACWLASAHRCVSVGLHHIYTFVFN